MLKLNNFFHRDSYFYIATWQPLSTTWRKQTTLAFIPTFLIKFSFFNLQEQENGNYCNFFCESSYTQQDKFPRTVSHNTSYETDQQFHINLFRKPTQQWLQWDRAEDNRQAACQF